VKDALDDDLRPAVAGDVLRGQIEDVARRGELRELEEAGARAAPEALAEDHDVAMVDEDPLDLLVAGDVGGEIEPGPARGAAIALVEVVDLLEQLARARRRGRPWAGRMLLRGSGGRRLLVLAGPGEAAAAVPVRLRGDRAP